ETPSRKGSASGLRSRDCRTAPHSPSPAPHTAASRVRGSRRSQMIPSRMGVREDSPPPSRETTTAQTSRTAMSAGPIVIAAATESASRARPPAHSSRTPRGPSLATGSVREAEVAQALGDLLDSLDGADRRVHGGAAEQDVALVADRVHVPGDPVALQEADLGLRRLCGLALAGEVADDAAL